MAITSAAVRAVPAGVHHHWLLEPIGPNDNQCEVVRRSSTADCGSLYYSPKKVCQIIDACCMLHNLALRRQVSFLQEDEPGDGLVAAVEPVDSDEEEAEEDVDNKSTLI
ncbi:hypothetical protein NDU88_001100 [Pleurodeles waltl]|uniref:Nuclease HARBI1 n=1 Tax=Pleurodeles waltl TaxID=8319 RepID=A0AAV7WJG3_PLEWA|nr:hypothetical protein NDU88_001100 [Pleurodeles waltl]